jgi:hypothetical protein
MPSVPLNRESRNARTRNCVVFSSLGITRTSADSNVKEVLKIEVGKYVKEVVTYSVLLLSRFFGFLFLCTKD